MRRSSLALGLLAVVMVGGAAVGATIYVPDDHASITAACVAAADGDEIVIRDGTYTEDVVLGNGPADFRSITVRSENGPSGCILDGESNSRCIDVQAPNVTVQGLTLAWGNGDAVGGGGLRCNQGGVPVVMDCVFLSNSGAAGGALLSEYTSPIVMGCTFYDNWNSDAGNGGAIKQFEDWGGVSSLIDSNVFWANKGFYYGGAVHLEECVGTTVNNVMAGNQSDWAGGGLCTLNSYSTKYSVSIHETIMDNRAYTGGGGIYGRNCDADYYNTICWGNSSAFWDPNNDWGGEGYAYCYATNCDVGVIENDDFSFLDLTDCINVDPGVVARGSALDGWWAGGDGVGGFAMGDYHLMEGSPCRNIGTSTDSYPDDMDGETRDGTPDIGADEWHDPVVATVLCPAFSFEGNSLFAAQPLGVDGSTSLGATDYLWTQLDGIDVGISGSTAAVVPFSAPTWDGSTELTIPEATLVFQLDVNAGASTDTCTCYVRIPGDSNGDNQVNAFDLALVRKRDPGADFNGDTFVNAFDLASFRIHHGRSRL